MWTIIRALIKIFLLIAILTASLCVSESFLAQAHYQKYTSSKGWTVGDNNSLFSIDPKRIYALTPNIGGDDYWASTPDGFRYRPAPTEISQYTLVAVGDSFTYGHGVTHAEAYPYLLEKKLNSAGVEVRVINAGVPGYGPDQEYI